MCGAKTGNAYGSDHVLFRTRLKVHLSSAAKISRARRLDVTKIRQPGTVEALDREIRSCFSTRTGGEGSTAVDPTRHFIDKKIRIYRASVWSVLLYGCECWVTRIEDERKLEAFDHCLRTILRVKYTDFVSNETVRNRCVNIARISQAIQERRLRCFGHVLRRPPCELSVTALELTPLPNWRCREGGQIKTWPDTVRQDMEVVSGTSLFGVRRWRREWIELSRSAAADRHACRSTIRDIIEAG
ncbi:unnamed protein product [Schistocephalus solidus]|uniref:Uncharacterized protein n=1 Tax=Schistocephalus solidus TaxID=70667 RepID=A0A183SM34_SCHSO|nr:unnamed protein product [Schistocephalus solidus]